MSDTDRNYVSTWTWFWMLFVAAIPLVGLIMVILWAFTGDNEMRKNYFRARLLWMVIRTIVAAAIVTICIVTGVAAAILSNVHH
jgi:hypothetical protein